MSEKNNTQGTNRETSKGWYENKNPLTNKAPVHQKVALKNEFEKQGFKDATAIIPSIKSKDKEDKNFISVCLSVKAKDRSKFDEATEAFMEENDIEVETETKGDSITAKLPISRLEDYVSFLGDKGFKLDDKEEKQVEAILEKDDAKTDKTDKKAEEDGNSSK